MDEQTKEPKGELKPEQGRWRKAVPDQMLEDGDCFLVRVPLHEDSGGGEEWHIVKVRCDEGRFELRSSEDEYWGWEWADIEWWIPVKELRSLGDRANTALWIDCLKLRLEKLPEAKNTHKPMSSAIGAINRLEIERDALRAVADAEAARWLDPTPDNIDRVRHARAAISAAENKGKTHAE